MCEGLQLSNYFFSVYRLAAKRYPFHDHAIVQPFYLLKMQFSVRWTKYSICREGEGGKGRKSEENIWKFD